MEGQVKSGTVSIIVPMHNARNFIQETIFGVVNQTYEDWELLLVDDGSSDGTVNEIEGLLGELPVHVQERIKVHLLPENIGAAKARNAGLEATQGRYVAYLDADDIWKPEKLERQLAYMDETGASFSFTGYEFADEKGNGTGKIVQVPKTIEYKQALKNTTIFTSTVMFDTDRVSKESLRMPVMKSEDTALWWRILKAGHTGYGLDENLVSYRRAGRTLSSNKLEAIRRIWNLYRQAEGLSIPASLYNFFFWAVRAVKRRV